MVVGIPPRENGLRGEDALDRLDASVDVVLLDRRMPDIAGEQVLATIRESDFDCRVALVTSVELDYESLPLGFDDYLHKPVSQAALETLVDSLLARREYSDKLQEYFALVSKRATLEAEKDAAELPAHPDVRKLDDRIADLGTEVDGMLSEFSEAEYRALFTAFPSDEDVDPGEAVFGNR